MAQALRARWLHLIAMLRGLSRPFWMLLLPALSSWAACQGGGAAGGALPTAGMPNAGGGAASVAGAPEPSSGGVAGTGAEGGAAGNAPFCEDDAEPNAWASWPLPDPTTTGESDSQSFTLTAEVATDDVTGLEWQRHLAPERFSWRSAQQYCACLSLGGHDDWRLPSRMELVSIVDYTRQNPSLDASVFPETPFEWFWSASPVADETEQYWYVAFFDGDTHPGSSEQLYRARCVRHQPGQLPRYDISPSTVKDASTGLTWQREASTTRVSWQDADSACTALELDGGGWRLPSMKELQSLIDESRVAPAIDSEAFAATPSEGFWAATPLAGTDTAAWFVSFNEGIAYNAVHEHPYRYRCVR
jgi:formylglycine-generating enzyme required for sulfatase activity